MGKLRFLPKYPDYPPRVEMVIDLLEACEATESDWDAVFSPHMDDIIRLQGFSSLTRLNLNLIKLIGEVGFYLNFSKVRKLDLEVAKAMASWKMMPEALARFKRYNTHTPKVNLTGLDSISLDVAKVLYAKTWLFLLPSPKALDAELAAILVKEAQASLTLSSVQEIDLDTARLLSAHKGYLCLDGLTCIDQGIAEELGSHQGLLALDSLESMDADVAKALFQHAEPISLEGLVGLDAGARKEILNHTSLYFLEDPLREEVCRFGGILSEEKYTKWAALLEEGGGESIPHVCGQLESLGATRADWYRLFTYSFFDGIERNGHINFMGIQQLHPLFTECVALGARVENIKFDSLDSIDAPSIEMLGNSIYARTNDKRVSLYLKGLCSIPPELAKALSNFPGEIYLHELGLDAESHKVLKEGTAKIHLKLTPAQWFKYLG